MSAKVTLKFNMPDFEGEARKRMHEAVNEVRNKTLETLSGSRSGRTYRVPGTKKTYTASAPGEPPAQATGELRQSIKTAVGHEGKEVVGIVGTNKIQGKMMEFGTRFIAPRPWLKKSFDKSESKVKSILSRKWF